MALSGKSEIETAIRHSVTLREELKEVLERVCRAADEADEGELEEVQEILQMIADADYEEPDLL
jgi:Cu/Ag efflux pump CusA